MRTTINTSDLRLVAQFDTAYGGNISAAESPIFEHLGLGKEGECPAPAYSLIPQHTITIMVAACIVNGMDPADVVNSPNRFAHYELNLGAEIRLVGAAFSLIGYTDQSPEDACARNNPEGSDRVAAIIDTHTGRIVCYHYWIEGDGTELIFL